jgi:hypothetical protein
MSSSSRVKPAEMLFVASSKPAVLGERFISEIAP